MDQALTATQQLLKQGILPEAAKAEQQARSGIDQLKNGIERAAESVLGNEVDSLKRAKKELAQLSQQLENEIRSNSKVGEGDQQGKQPGKPGSDEGKAPATQGQGKEGQGKGEGQSNPEGNGEGQGEGKGTSGESSQPGEPSNSPGEGKGTGQVPGEGPGQGAGGEGSPGEPSSDASSQTTTKPEGNERPSSRQSPAGLRSGKGGGSPRPGGPGREQPQPGEENSENGSSGGNGQGGGPLTGGNYAEFNERLRDVESMISDPRLQAEVQKVRDRARSARAEFKRHTQTPNWEMVRTSVHQPMIELQQRLADEIAKQESPDSLVPVDRDPVPTRYRDLVRGYYERLGSGKDE